MEVWEKVKSCIRNCSVQCIDDPVVALSVSTQGEAIIPIDSMMNPLTFAPISADLRGLEYVDELKGLYGEERIYSLTGQNLDAIHSIFKIKWWAHNTKNIFEKCWKFCCFDSFINICMGLPPVTDRSMAARMMLFDITNNWWSPELLGFAGIDSSNLPEIVDSGQVIGVLSQKTCKDLGFVSSVSVISGGHDQPCAAFGNGLIDSGINYSIGTTECISIIRKAEDVELLKNTNPTYPHVIEGSLVTLIGSQTGTRFFGWFQDLLRSQHISAIPFDSARFFDLIRTVPEMLETTVTLLPHLSGGSTLYSNSNAKAHLLNFSQETSAMEFFKAFLEGITIEQFLGYQKFITTNELESMKSSIVATGGGVRFPNWIEIKASIFKTPFQLMESNEAGCIGAAMLAGIGVQAFSSPIQAVEQCVHKLNIINPDSKMAEYYSNKVKQFDMLYHLLNK